jgi:hypothetical protein
VLALGELALGELPAGALAAGAASSAAGTSESVDTSSSVSAEPGCFPSTTIGVPQPLQRIFTLRPRTLSSAIVYLALQDSHVIFIVPPGPGEVKIAGAVGVASTMHW